MRSDLMKKGLERAPHRTLFKAMGYTDEEIAQPLIGVVNSANEIIPGHIHLDIITEDVKSGIRMVGGTPVEFPVIGVCDGIAMGHEGMLYSLPSRELIADSVEYMVNAHMADAMICISNCDKITPGMLMAAMRLNIPAIFVSGGPMEAGAIGNRRYDLIDAMVMAADSSVSDSQIAQLEIAACPTCLFSVLEQAFCSLPCFSLLCLGKRAYPLTAPFRPGFSPMKAVRPKRSRSGRLVHPWFSPKCSYKLSEFLGHWFRAYKHVTCTAFARDSDRAWPA